MNDNKQKAKELVKALEICFKTIGQTGIKFEITSDDALTSVTIDGEIDVVIDYREREEVSLLAQQAMYEFHYDVSRIKVDPGCMYHADGSGTPPSEDYEDIETCESIACTCKVVMTEYMANLITIACMDYEMGVLPEGENI